MGKIHDYDYFVVSAVYRMLLYTHLSFPSWDNNTVCRFYPSVFHSFLPYSIMLWARYVLFSFQLMPVFLVTASILRFIFEYLAKEIVPNIIDWETVHILQNVSWLSRVKLLHGASIWSKLAAVGRCRMCVCMCICDWINM